MLDIERTQTVFLAVVLFALITVITTILGPIVGLSAILSEGPMTFVFGLSILLFAGGVLTTRYSFNNNIRAQVAGVLLTVVGVILIMSFAIGRELISIRNTQLLLTGLVVYFVTITLYGYSQTGKDFANWEVTTAVLLVITGLLVIVSQFSVLLEPFAFITFVLSLMTHTLYITGRTKRPDVSVLESGSRLVTGFLGLPFELFAYVIDVIRRVRG